MQIHYFKEWQGQKYCGSDQTFSPPEDGNPVVDLVTTDDGNIFVLFSNGSIQSLQQCLQDSKSESRGEAAADHTNLYVKNFSERSHLVQRLQTHVFHHNGRLYSSHIYSVVHPRTKVGGKNGDSTDWLKLEHAFFGRQVDQVNLTKPQYFLELWGIFQKIT